MFNKIDINEILNKVDKLPGVNQVAMCLIKMLDDENARVQDLAQVISSDPALTTQLLKLSNSAYYGYSREISTISDAIAKLGFKTIRSMAFMAVSHNAINKEIKGYSLYEGELWNNSVTCAVFSKYLAQKFDYPDTETAFVAGLLRDIGKLVIDEYVGISYEKIIDKVNMEKISFCQAEEALFGFDHGYVGAKLIEMWNFPPALVETIRYHHDFRKAVDAGSENLELISIVHIADAFTMMMGSSLGNDGLMYYIDTEIFKQLGLSEDPVSTEQLFAEIADQRLEVKKLKGMINA
jgi:HD-like signal output (HDOD) protein